MILMIMGLLRDLAYSADATNLVLQHTKYHRVSMRRSHCDFVGHDQAQLEHC